MVKGGLSPGEVKDLRAAWQHILNPNIGDLATGFLIQWWMEDQSMKELFPNFAGKQISELKSMPRVRSHGVHIFMAITGILLNLESDEVVAELLADLKRDHEEFKGRISAEAYLKFSKVAHAYLLAKLGPLMTTAGASGLTKMFALLGSEGEIHH